MEVIVSGLSFGEVLFFGVSSVILVAFLSLFKIAVKEVNDTPQSPPGDLPAGSMRHAYLSHATRKEELPPSACPPPEWVWDKFAQSARKSAPKISRTAEPSRPIPEGEPTNDIPEAPVIEFTRESLVSRYNRICAIYTEAETSPETILDRPIILDVNYHLTITFHKEFSRVRKLVENDDSRLESLAEAVDAFENAWIELDMKAREIGIPDVTPAMRERARRHLNYLLDPSITEHEKELHLTKLSEIITIGFPPKSDHAIEWKQIVAKSVAKALERGRTKVLALEAA